MTENDVNPPINNDPMEKKKKQIYRSPLVNDYMNLYEYQQSRSFIHSDSTLLNFFFLETACPIEAKFSVEPPWDGERKFDQTV